MINDLTVISLQNSLKLLNSLENKLSKNINPLLLDGNSRLTSNKIEVQHSQTISLIFLKNAYLALKFIKTNEIHNSKKKRT
jgi:hypothetical protein